MHNVDFKSDSINPILYFVNVTMFSKGILMFTIYEHRFQINTIFMHNVDFKSDL